MQRRPTLDYLRHDVGHPPRPVRRRPRWVLFGWGAVIACAASLLALLLFPELALLCFPLYR